MIKTLINCNKNKKVSVIRIVIGLNSIKFATRVNNIAHGQIAIRNQRIP